MTGTSPAVPWATEMRAPVTLFFVGQVPLLGRNTTKSMTLGLSQLWKNSIGTGMSAERPHACAEREAH